MLWANATPPLTAPSARKVQFRWPSEVRYEEKVPPWSPRNTLRRSTSGEDSLPAGSECDHATFPVLIDTATTAPLPGDLAPGLVESRVKKTSLCRMSRAGEAAASVPILRCQSRWPLVELSALAYPF